MGIVSKTIKRAAKRGRKYVRDTLGRFARQSFKRDIAGAKAIGRFVVATALGPMPRAVAPARKRKQPAKRAAAATKRPTTRRQRSARPVTSQQRANAAADRAKQQRLATRRAVYPDGDVLRDYLTNKTPAEWSADMDRLFGRGMRRGKAVR